jgi:membrane fusion protein (multidrug efflux system)
MISEPISKPQSFFGTFPAVAPRARHWLGRLVLFGHTLLIGCASEAKSEPNSVQRETFPVAKARIEDSIVERKYVTEVRAVRYAEVRTRVEGILNKVLVDEGQAVKGGAPLFTINARDLKQAVTGAKAAEVGAEAELRAAELEFRNTQLLFDKDVVSKAELDLSQARVDALRAKVAEWNATVGRSEVELGYAQIGAPFDGVVNRIPHKAGSAVTEAALLTTVADTSEVHAYFRLTEREYLEFAARRQDDRPKQAWLELVDGSMHPEPGVIDAVENEVDRQTGSIALRAKFPNSEGLIKHGSGGKVVLRQKLPKALLVPQQATFEVQGDLFVFIVDQDNVAHARKIEPKLRLGADFVLDAGLTPDERFVLEGAQKLRDGAKVETSPPHTSLWEG